ncbi:MAG: gliding motility lipoprotein GldB [Sphingobacteriaceae bacterium]|nr:gliding motility lipoprotein GldB [Sphingobacteriaceae bacterium]
MNLKSTFQIYLFFLIALFVFACKNKKDVDVSHIDLEIKIERFDKELSSLTPQDLEEKIPALQKKYGFFYQDFIEGMLSVGNTGDTSYLRNLRTVLTDKDFNDLKAEVASKFPDLEKQENELEDAFKHVKYYYPNQGIPKVIAFFSGFSVQTPIGNNYVGVGLDMFLGANSKFYPAIRGSLPAYITRRFTPENITPRVMEAFIREDLFPEPDETTSLMQKMIYNGKILYFMDAVMPDLPDSLKIGYTSAQYEWAESYEAGIWGYFLEQNLVYEADYMKIQKYLTEAPFTPGIGEKNESAPKLGVFIGWKIVKEYMDKNPEVTIQALMKDQDFQKILDKSKYRPD